MCYKKGRIIIEIEFWPKLEDTKKYHLVIGMLFMFLKITVELEFWIELYESQKTYGTCQRFLTNKYLRNQMLCEM